MKKRLFIIIGILIALAVAGYFVYGVFATSNPHTWTDGLVGYWSFDGQYTTSTAGTRDVSNNGNWGAFSGGVKPGLGISGQALSFDGVDDYVDAGNGASLRINGNISYEGWIYVDSPSGYDTFIYSDGGASIFHHFYYSAGSMVWRIRDANSVNITVSAAISTKDWHHVVGVRGNGKMILYIDGVLANSQNDTFTGSTLAGNSLGIGAETDILSHYLNGKIDEVRVYNRALSADEVKQHYDQTRRNFVVATSVPSTWWTDGLVGYWNFDGQNTTSTNGTRDASGNNNWGTFNGGVRTGHGVSGQGLSFDGVNDYVDLGDPALGILDPTSVLTVEAWIYPKSDGEGDNGRIITNVGSVDLALTDESNGYVRFYVQVVGNTQTQTSRTIPLNTWSHIAVTFTSNVHYIVYYNGVNILEENSNTALADDVANKIIGNWPAGSRTFDGLIDEVRIYNRALGADEVKQHYQQTRRNLGL